MRPIRLLTLALALSLPAAAQAAPPREEPGFHARLQARYCAKLREGPRAFALFVRRMQTVYGYTFSDFFPERPGARARVDCDAIEEPRRRI
jgi:hypothetical protein